MDFNKLVYGIIPFGEIQICKNEIKRRLGGELGKHPTYAACLARFEKEAEYKYAYEIGSADFSSEGVCDLSFTQIRSRDLYKNLKNCNAVAVVGVTLGIRVERLMAGLKLISPAEHFITDAIASAAVDSLCDYIDNRIKSEFICRPRYSPGFGDCGIENQKVLLDRLCAGKTLGITLNDSYFMTPSKSITALVGIIDEKDN